MIRIDEIYNNTFWPWVRNNLPLTRMFFCDPPGSTEVDSLFNFGSDVVESNYLYFHDQEPIHLDVHTKLFDEVKERNRDLNNRAGPAHSGIITSELNSEFVQQACKKWNWKHYYFFFHGWASLDWYRGYHRSFLMPEPRYRNITHSVIAPNRIIGGKRDHRVLLLYKMFKEKVKTAWISSPQRCPSEDVDIVDIGRKYLNHYPDIVDVLSNEPLPKHFPGEEDLNHPMHSCWLSLFDQCQETLAYLVTETVFFGRRNHLTEKTFKPICLKMPFVMASAAGSLDYLRSYGFKTFSDLWDESYDEEIDDLARIDKLGTLIKQLDDLSAREKQQIYRASIPIVEHNFSHFYGGNFEKILWQELISMLNQMKKDFQCSI